MAVVDRRAFLAGSAAAVARSVLAAAAVRPDFDIVIVGAGAAGIAAARRVLAAGRSCVVLEASSRWGGRCFTDVRTFGIPYERGARWIYMPDENPLARLAIETGLEVRSVSPRLNLRQGRRNARDSEMEEFFANLLRCQRAISEAAGGKVDIPGAQALPKDLGEWRRTMEFVFGELARGKALSSISAMDFAETDPRDGAAYCRQGLGTLVGKLALGVPIQFFSPVTRIRRKRRLVEVEARGTVVTARSAIVTASTGVLASGKVEFQPELPALYVDAINKLGLGSFEQIAIEFAGNPLGLGSDEFVFEKVAGPRTAALFANVLGTSVSVVQIAGSLAAQLAERGEAEMTTFAIDWLARLFGSDLKQAVGRTHATRWTKEPWVLGAFSAASPGGYLARKTLSEPMDECLWFAGEAVHETRSGTVAGAWEAGERAADAAMRRLDQQ